MPAKIRTVHAKVMSSMLGVSDGLPSCDEVPVKIDVLNPYPRARTFSLGASSGLAADSGLLRFREGDKLTADGTRLLLDMPRQGKLSVKALMCALTKHATLARKAARAAYSATAFRNFESNDCAALEPVSPPLSPPAEGGVGMALLGSVASAPTLLIRLLASRSVAESTETDLS